MELAGFDGYALKEAGYGARELKECGLKSSVVFDVAELKAEGFTAKVKAEGCTYSLTSLTLLTDVTH